MSIKFLNWFFIVLFVSGCSGDYLPRPLGYNRIDLPERTFDTLNGNYPYLFEVPRAATVEQDTFNLEQKAWINLNYREMGAKVHLTYLPLGTKGGDVKMVLNDAINLTAKHQIKAYGIEESILLTPKGYTAVVAELSGEVPTQFQFFVTDSTDHFLRGALYFNTAMKNDSLAPVIEHIKIDMTHLINTLQFKNE
ncbi:gliding motility-associated lipoprotein GldD [Belliella baltica DSM 15883]|uniref:Gliding motility-associated lipoprotein GldD n=1 Tax=Belliella baltica (strain DSM 15883 / CIP 108006 / LMG 21964 / BA134) TaxID=866536 RepID=I3Z2K6_BELBD|nr:gliding motility lipoprotein GldD [Belliella baltica]AFL83474.1 gliding motility-associated lipoprotein GldD [Belliella baltica DSM 15883]